jgi:hypothetical protein
MKNSKTLFITIAFLFLSFYLKAQDSQVKQKEIHIGVGPAAYSGDLGNGYNGASMMFNAGLSFNKHRKLNGNLRLSIGSVTGQELDYSLNDGTGVAATPNSFFKSNFIGFNFEGHLHIIQKERFRLYVSQGIGIFRFNPKDEFSNSLLDQSETRPLGESYRNIALQIPTQIGAKYYLLNDFAIGFQVGFINPITDYLDNLSAWGNKNGNDNILSLQFQLHIPL